MVNQNVTSGWDVLFVLMMMMMMMMMMMKASDYTELYIFMS